MATDAIYIDGKSKIPQPRPAAAVEPAYVDGQSGTVPIAAYVAAAGGRPMPQRVFSGPFVGPCRGPLC